jgi:hypothetical protein
MENREQKIYKDPKDFNWDSVGLDFGNWEEEKIWALDLPKQEMDISELLWHFDVPFWTDDKQERWTINPWDVVNGKNTAKREIERMEQSNLDYPIDIMENHGRYLVLDGLHRLVKAYKNGQKRVMVRIIPRERFDEIKSDYPMELPER